VTRPQLQVWLEKYGKAWETRDPDAVAALFTDGAAYYETPFGKPAQGRTGVHAYWRAATGHQRNVKFSFEVLSVHGDVGIARWWAEFTRVSTGVKTRLDGVFLLEFDADGFCRTLREWWHKTQVPE
jgi:ketosteroid isomerase-like protein